MWFAYLYLALLATTALFIVAALIIEYNVKEGTPFKKWWRENVIGIAPDDIDI